MKLRYQQGGTFVPPFAVYQPYILPTSQQGTTSSSKSSKSSKSNSDIGLKDILGLVEKINGLPGDIRAIQGRVAQLLSNVQKKLEAPEGLYGGTNSIATEYAELLTLASTVSKQDAYYQKAKENAIAKGSLNEVVIDSSGRIKALSLDTQKYEWISLSEYEENPDLYRPVTNGQLLDSRFNGDGGLAFDTESVTAVADGVSMKSISDRIQAMVEHVGSQSVSTTGYVSKANRDVLQGIQTFREATKTTSGIPTIDTLVKEKGISKNQASQIAAAFNYIYANLNVKEKTLLHYNARNIEGGLQGLLSQLILSKQDIAYEYEPYEDVAGSKSGKKGDNTPTSIIEEFEMNPAELLEAGYGNKNGIVIQTPEGKSTGISVTTVSLPLMDADKNPLGAYTTLKDVSKGAYSGYLDLDNVSMGGGMIDPLAASDVTISGGVIHTAYLPVSAENSNKPDIDLIRRFNELQKNIVEKGIQNDIEKVNQYLIDNKFPAMYNKKGEVLINNYRKFAMMNGTAIDTAFNSNVALEKWLTEVENENQIKNSLRIIAQKRGVEVEFDTKSWWDAISPFWNDHNSLYKGVIFIPVINDITSRAVGSGNYLSTKEAEVLDAVQQNALKARTVNHAGNII